MHVGMLLEGMASGRPQPAEAIRAFVSGVVDGSVSRPQAAAWLAWAYARTLTAEETLAASKKGEPAKIDPDVLEEAAETLTASLDNLVEGGKLTPAAKAKLSAALVGETGKRPAIALSRTAGVAAGFSGAIGKQIVEALKDNDPIALSKHALSRGVAIPRADEKPPTTAEPDKDIALRRSAAYGKTAK